MFSITTIATLIVFVCISSYLQTLTGFAFALIFMGAVAMTGVVSFQDGAVIATLLMLVNATSILLSERRLVARSAFFQIVPFALVGTIAGVLALPVLIAISAEWLKFAFGVAVIASSLRLLFGASEPTGGPNPIALSMSGLIGGIMGGLFAVPGPPIVYSIQRHFTDQRQIRATLVAIFSAISLTRIVSAGVSSGITTQLLLSALALVPATLFATEIARRWPPPLSRHATRLLTVALLVLTGVSLMLPAVINNMH